MSLRTAYLWVALLLVIAGGGAVAMTVTGDDYWIYPMGPAMLAALVIADRAPRGKPRRKAGRWAGAGGNTGNAGDATGWGDGDGGSGGGGDGGSGGGCGGGGCGGGGGG